MSDRNEVARLKHKIALVFITSFASVSVFGEETGWPAPVEDNPLFGMVIADQLEYRSNQEGDTLRWDVQGWYGTDYNKFWTKFEGEDLTSSNGGELELQALYSRNIAPFWDFQIGVRYDRMYGLSPDRDRGFAVIGFQGFAPYRFDVEPALFVSDDGDVSARLTATYDMLFTQRLILQPRIETNVSVSPARRFGVGSGINYVELGLRLRYQIQREFAPYIGFSWQRLLGNTEDIARSQGEKFDNFALVAGLRMWF